MTVDICFALPQKIFKKSNNFFVIFRQVILTRECEVFYLWVTIWSRSFENKKNNLEVPLTVASWMLQEKVYFWIRMYQKIVQMINFTKHKMLVIKYCLQLRQEIWLIQTTKSTVHHFKVRKRIWNVLYWQ